MIIDEYDKLFDKAGFKYTPELSEFYGWDFSFYYERNEVTYCFSGSTYYEGYNLSVK
jgi:hypothetical protein